MKSIASALLAGLCAGSAAHATFIYRFDDPPAKRCDVRLATKPDLGHVIVRVATHAERYLTEKDLDLSGFTKMIRTSHRDAFVLTEDLGGPGVVLFLAQAVTGRRLRADFYWNPARQDLVMRRLTEFSPRRDDVLLQTVEAEAPLRGTGEDLRIGESAAAEARSLDLSFGDLRHVLAHGLGPAVPNPYEPGSWWVVGVTGSHREVKLEYDVREGRKHLSVVKIASPDERRRFVSKSGAMHETAESREITLRTGALAGERVFFAPGIAGKIAHLHRVSRTDLAQALEQCPDLAPIINEKYHEGMNRWWCLGTLPSGRTLKVAMVLESDGTYKVLSSYDAKPSYSRLFERLTRMSPAGEPSSPAVLAH